VWDGVHFINHYYSPSIIHYYFKKSGWFPNMINNSYNEIIYHLGIMVVHLSRFGSTLVWFCFIKSCWFIRSSLNSIDISRKTSRSWKDSHLPLDDLPLNDLPRGDSLLSSDDILGRLPFSGTSFIVAYNTFGKPLVVCGHVTLPKSLGIFGSSDEILAFDVLWVLGPIQVSSNVISWLKTTFLVLGLKSLYALVWVS